jgi:hypothetical protein
MRFSRILRYSCRHSHFRALHTSLRSCFLARGTLPYRPPIGRARSFGVWLEPRYIVRAGAFDQ